MIEKRVTRKLLPASDEAVKAKTGKVWAQWFAVLDRAGARKMSHTEIASHLLNQLGCPSWWNQMVTVGYERARGMRKKHERSSGFAVSVSRTIGASVPALFRAWKDARVRSRWLKHTPITIRTATAPRFLRITWSDRKTHLEVNFYPKGLGRGQVVVEHTRLPDAKSVAKMKSYWRKALERLSETFEA